MENSAKLSRIRIYASSTDKINNQPVYEAIVYLAKEFEMAGATALRGVMGFGGSSVIHSSKLWELTEKLPVIIEIVDEKRKIDDFIRHIRPLLNKMSKGCLVTTEDVEVVHYQKGKKN